MTHGIRGYNPVGAGILTGGGGPGHYRSSYPISLMDISKIKEEVEDYEEDKEYSEDEMILLAEKILLMDPKLPTEDPMWLNGRMHRARKRREIYCAVGTPDPSVESGLYWRTHPNGRGVNSDYSRKEHRAGYYKD